MVRAYWLATERGTPGEVYNVGRGSCMRVGDMLDILLSHTSARISVEQDPGDHAALTMFDCCGRTSTSSKGPLTRADDPFEKTMADLLEYWRDRIRASTATSLVARPGNGRGRVGAIASGMSCWRGFLGAVQFLTRVPLPTTENNLGEALGWLPLVGLLIRRCSRPGRSGPGLARRLLLAEWHDHRGAAADH